MIHAKQTKSGSWTCCVHTGGIYKRFTAKTREACEVLANSYKKSLKVPDTAKMTIGDAVESYIKASEMSLKPSTLASYENIRKNYLKSLYPLPLLSVDNCQIQKAVNFELSCHARHTVVNSLSLLRATLEMFHPDFCLKVKLPKNQPKYKDFPTPEAVLQAVKGTEIEAAVLLSVWSTLRLGEIEGLQWKDIAADGTCLLQRQRTTVYNREKNAMNLLSVSH